jgi:hypothetical protein
MKKGTKVKWSSRNATQGTGLVISDEEDGYVLVAMDREPGYPLDLSELHYVIRCAVTWLTPV